MKTAGKIVVTIVGLAVILSTLIFFMGRYELALLQAELKPGDVMEVESTLVFLDAQMNFHPGECDVTDVHSDGHIDGVHLTMMCDDQQYEARFGPQEDTVAIYRIYEGPVISLLK